MTISRLNYPMNNQFIPDIHLRLAALVSDLETHLIGSSHEQFYRTTFGDLKNALENNTFRLAVLGPWSSGKSCLINRLLDEDPEGGLLPVKDEPCTAKLTNLKYGEARVSKKWDDGTEEVLAEGADDCRASLKIEAVTKGEGILNVCWPAELLKGGAELVDTPGLFDPDEEKSVVTIEALSRFHGVIFVVPVDMPVDMPILKFLEDTLIRKTKGKFFYLINKIDRMPEEEGPVEEQISWCFEEIRKHLEKESSGGEFHLTRSIGTLVDRERFFGVSACTGQGVDEVSAAMRNYLQTGTFKELVEIGCGKTDALIEYLKNGFAVEQAAKMADAKKLEEILLEAADHVTTIENQIKQTEAAIGVNFGDLGIATKKKIRGLVQTLSEEGTEALNVGLWKKLTKPEQVRKNLRSLQRSLSERTEDGMELIERELQTKIKGHIEDYDRFVESKRNEIRGFANRLDTVIQEGIEDRVRKERANPHSTVGPNSQSSQEVDFHRNELLASLGAGTAAGAGLAFATGAVGTATTSVVVSTAATWVPLWIAQSLGMTTAVSSTAFTVSAAGLAACLGGPLAATTLLFVGFVNYRKATQAIGDFERFLEKNLDEKSSEFVDTMKSELGLIADGLVAGIKADVFGAYSRLLEVGGNMVRAAKGEDRNSGDELRTHLADWTTRNDAFKEELKHIE